MDHGAYSKKALRQSMLEKRKGLSKSEAARLSGSITGKLLETPEYKASRKIALYSSFNNEVSTLEILSKSLDAGMEVYFPRTDSSRSHLSFVRVCALKDLVPGIFDIAEPKRGECTGEISVDALDLIIVPGVAFDRTGARLGYGKGFYDRVLSGAGAFLIGLAYEFQIIGGELPREEHDVSMDCVVTETEIARFPRQRRRD